MGSGIFGPRGPYPDYPSQQKYTFTSLDSFPPSYSSWPSAAYSSDQGSFYTPRRISGSYSLGYPASLHPLYQPSVSYPTPPPQLGPQLGWPLSQPSFPVADKGLETILIAILILAALDTLIVRPLKRDSYRKTLLQQG